MNPTQHFCNDSELLDVYSDLLVIFEDWYSFCIYDFWKVNLAVEDPITGLKPSRVSLI